MTCDTGECEECSIWVGATTTPFNLPGDENVDFIQTYHLFILYKDLNQEIVYRGGPMNNGTYQDAVDRGEAQQYSAPTRERFDIDMPFGNLITNRQVGTEGNHDVTVWQANGAREDLLVMIAEGTQYCGMDAAFTHETRRIGELGRTYNAIHLDRIDNSNATVYTILQEMGLPLIKPNVHAPGWGTNLHTETTVPENIANAAEQVIDQTLEPVRQAEREINRFNNLPALDQYNFLRQLFR